MFSILAILMHFIMRDVYHHKGVFPLAVVLWGQEIRGDSREKTNLYQMQFCDNSGIQGHPSSNTPNYIFATTSNHIAIVTPPQGHMTATAVTCSVQQERNSENLDKYSGELKSRDISASIYTWVLKYNASCLTYSLVLSPSLQNNTPNLQKLQKISPLIWFLFCHLFTGVEITLTSAMTEKVKSNGLNKGRDRKKEKKKHIHVCISLWN